jgi:predicted transcriptional regulator YdeE
MGIDEIAKELAVACLSHDRFAAKLEPQNYEVADAKASGEKVGEFYNAIYRTLLQERTKESPKSHSF